MFLQASTSFSEFVESSFKVGSKSVDTIFIKNLLAFVGASSFFVQAKPTVDLQLQSAVFLTIFTKNTPKVDFKSFKSKLSFAQLLVFD